MSAVRCAHGPPLGRRHLRPHRRPDGGRVHDFADPATTNARLEAAGFTGIDTWLSDEPTTFAAGEPFETYLETICLGDLVQPLDPADRTSFVAEVARRMPAPALDYVRLNIVATRA